MSSLETESDTEVPHAAAEPDVEVDTTALNYAAKIGFGVTTGMIATFLVHPLDVWKFNRQVSLPDYGTRVNTIKRLMRNGGIRGLYPGLTANLLSQALYVSTALGCYGLVKGEIDSIYDNEDSFDEVARDILFATCIGAFVTTLPEIGLVRTAIDRQQPERFRKYYSGGMNAMSRILSSEGLMTAFRGTIPTIGRAGVAMLSTSFLYYNIKTQMHQNEVLKDENFLRISSLALSSLCSAIITLPIDVIKTRYQAMRYDSMGRPEYCGYNDLFCKIRHYEGFSKYFRGFIPYTLRILVHTSAVIILLNGAVQYSAKYNEEEEEPPEPPPPEEEPEIQHRENEKSEEKLPSFRDRFFRIS